MKQKKKQYICNDCGRELDILPKKERIEGSSNFPPHKHKYKKYFPIAFLSDQFIGKIAKKYPQLFVKKEMVEYISIMCKNSGATKIKWGINYAWSLKRLSQLNRRAFRFFYFSSSLFLLASCQQAASISSHIVIRIVETTP